jgi:deazaflavin-dependent oxidoreductase (nitroreductase family)
MIITTTGRKTGQKHSVPIGYIPDGATYLGLNLGSHSHWFLNALANPCVILEIIGKKIEARAERVPEDNPQALQQALEVFARERPEMFRNFFGTSDDGPQGDELLKIGKRVGFLRFYPLT